MTDIELIEWCEIQGFSTKVAALLSVWNPDIDELEDWDVFEDEERNAVDINGDRYLVLDSDDYDARYEAYIQCIQTTIVEEVPDYLQKYVDWDRFFIDSDIQPNEVIEGAEKIDFIDGIYYYTNIWNP